jgi:hypothetical protein
MNFHCFYLLQTGEERKDGMALYLTNFERVNFTFGEENLIKQSIDIVFEFEEDINDKNIEQLHDRAFAELFEQFPSWKDHSPPRHCKHGWSTIFGPNRFKKIENESRK